MSIELALALALALATFLDLSGLGLGDALLAAALFASLSIYVLAAGRARRLVESPRAVRNMNRGAGAVLTGAGIAVAVR